MLDWVCEKLGIKELRIKMEQLEGRVDSLEKHIEETLRHFGHYNSRTKEELLLMKKQIVDLLESTEAIISHQENKDGIQRASRLKSRLRNNLTRIEKKLA